VTVDLGAKTENFRSLPWRRIAKRVVTETWDDDVFGRAAQLAYFWLFSLFPVLLIIFVILGFIAQGATLEEQLLHLLQRAIPPSSFGIVRETMSQITTHATAEKLSIGICTTLWAASSGMSAVIAALNKAYEVRDARPWWKARLIAAALTIALSVLTVIALAILLSGSKVGAVIGQKFGGSAWTTLWTVVQWPIIFAFVIAAVLLVYRFGPHLEDQKVLWLLPGAATTVVFWSGASVGLRLYLRYFDSYSTVYGSLGAVLVLLLWIYLWSVALLIGGELNSEIENAAAAAGARDAKRPGERSPGHAANDD